MNFYERLRTTANKLLKGKGQIVTLTSNVAGTYDAATGTSTITTSTQSIYAAVFDYGAKQIDGTLIKMGDKQLLVSALNTSGATITAPVVNDTVTVDGVVYTIVGPIKTIAPAGTVVMYDCNIRV